MARILPIAVLVSLLLYGIAGAETLTLQECLRRAAASNNELRVSSYDEKVAAEGIGIARSGYLPHLNFQGGYTVQQDAQSIEFQGRTIKMQQSDFGFFSVAAEQTIYDFGRTSSRYDRSRALRDAAALSHGAREKDVFLQVVEAYYGIMEYDKLLRSADEEVIQMTDHLRVAKSLYQQGVVTRNDLLQAEVQLANSKQRRLMESNRVANGWLFLNYLTGRPAAYRAGLEDTATGSQTDEGGVLSPEKRLEIQAIRKGLAADEMTVKETKSFYYPELFARLGVDYVQNSAVKEQAILYATVGLRVNLFDGLATTSRYRQAVQSRAQNEERLRMTEARIRLEYDSAVNDARTAAERIVTTEKSVERGEENLRINKDRYQEHVGTATDVIDAQTLLTRTRTDYYRAVFDYQVALARIKKAKGEL